MSLGRVIPRGDYNPTSLAGRVSHGFDFIRFEPLNVNDLLKVPVSFNVFKVPANLAGAEITRLHVSGEPRGVWFSRVSWLPIVSGGGPQEILAASNEPSFTNAGAAIPVPSSAATTGDGGLRYITYGSLIEPQPVSIAMAPNQQFGIKVLRIENVLNPVPVMVYVRAMGVFLRS